MSGAVKATPRRRLGSDDAVAITPFGAALRALRAERRLSLAELGLELGLSAQFLSGIETGRKNIPDGLSARIAFVMRLDAVEASTLIRAADQTVARVPVSHLPPDVRELVGALATRFGDLPVGLVDDLRRRLLT